MTYITNAMPEDARLPVAVVERMERYTSALTDLFAGDRAYSDWLPDEKRAFAVYLLQVNEQTSLDPSVIKRCSQRHFGTFDTWADARKALADLLGWPDALGESEQSGLGSEVRHLLTCGEDAIRARLHQLFLITELDDDTVYVFD